MSANDLSLSRPRAGAGPAAVAALVGLGAVFALAALALSDLESRWIVYTVGAAIFAVAVMVVSDRERFLWTTLVLSLQADVSLRFAYGHSGSRGLVFPLSTFAGAALLGWLLLDGRVDRRHPFRWGGRLAGPIAFYFATGCLSLLASSEHFIGVTQLLIEAECFLLYLIALNFVRSEETLERIVRLLLVTLVIQSLVYYAQSALGITFTLAGEVLSERADLPRPGGTVATSPGGFSAFVVPLLLLAAARYVTGRRPAEVQQAGIAALLGIIAVVLTFTRAAWAAAALGLGWIVLIGRRRGVLNLRRIMPIAIVAGAAALLLSPMIAARLGESSFDSAYAERLRLMRMALQVIAAEPLLGIGPGAYDTAFRAYLGPELQEGWVYTVHNVYLLRAAETGIPGGLALILLLAYGFRQAVRVTRAPQERLRVTAIGCGAALLAFAWLMYWNILRGLTYNALLWLLLGLMEAAERLAAAPASEHRRDRDQGRRTGRDLVRADIGH